MKYLVDMDDRSILAFGNLLHGAGTDLLYGAFEYELCVARLILRIGRACHGYLHLMCSRGLMQERARHGGSGPIISRPDKISGTFIEDAWKPAS